MNDRQFSRRLLTTLMRLYFPMVVALCVLSGLLAMVCVLTGLYFFGRLGVLFLLLGGLFAATTLDMVVACRVLWLPLPKMDDGLEIHPPPQWLKGLTALTAEVARRRKLPVPDEIRLHAADIAHVYQDDQGRKILVVGGPAVAMLSIKSLAGIIAHELGHFAAGDTALSRAGFRKGLSIELLVASFDARPASLLNPFTWLVRGYHFLFQAAWALNSRDQEFAADKHEAALVGPEVAAITSILISSLEKIPWANLTSIAESCNELRFPLEQIYSEQAKRAKQLSAVDWQDACRKALKEKTDLFDSHPCLRERLEAVGVSRKRAMDLAASLQQTGRPATELFANWNVVEQLLTERLVAIVRESQQTRREVAAVMLGRPVGRHPRSSVS